MPSFDDSEDTNNPSQNVVNNHWECFSALLKMGNRLLNYPDRPLVRWAVAVFGPMRNFGHCWYVPWSNDPSKLQNGDEFCTQRHKWLHRRRVRWAARLPINLRCAATIWASWLYNSRSRDGGPVGMAAPWWSTFRRAIMLHGYWHLTTLFVKIDDR